MAARYSHFVQVGYSVEKGVNGQKSGLIAGMRMGVLTSVNMLNWVLGGLPNPVARAMAADGSLPQWKATPGGVAPVAPAAAAAWGAGNTVDGVAYFITVGTVSAALGRIGSYPSMAAERPTVADIVAQGYVAVQLRRDEVLVLDATFPLSAGTVAELQEARWKGPAMVSGAAAMTMAFGVAMHLHRSEGHHFITEMRKNVCGDFFRAAWAATNMTGSLDEDVVAEVMHDALHPFANIKALVNLVMACTPDVTNSLVNNVCNTRYPFAMSGMGPITAGKPLALYVARVLRTKDLSALRSGLLRSEDAGLRLTRNMVVAMLELNRFIEYPAVQTAVTTGSQDVKTALQEKVRVGLEVASYLLGVCEGLGAKDATNSFMRAKSILTRADAALRAAGVTQGTRFSRMPEAQDLSYTTLGMEDVATIIGSPIPDGVTAGVTIVLPGKEYMLHF